jgi:DNA-binding transcriptional MerR regulator
MGKSLEAFRTISEVADELAVPKHVLRFWEVKFPQIRPMKRGGGRRYYRPEDLILLRGIRRLLHAEGYTIKGVQKILREQGIEQVKAQGLQAEPEQRSGKRTTGKGEAAIAASPPHPIEKAGRVRALPVALKQRASVGEKPPMSPLQRTAIEQAVRELEACRSALQALRPLPEASAQPQRGRALRSSR